MHARVDRNEGAESNALFFADLPDSASEQHLILPASERSAYGAHRKPNWPAIILIALFHAGLLGALIKLDVIQVKKKAPELVVINISEPAPPPIVEPPKPNVEPELVMPPIATPAPIVESISPPAQVMVAPPPPKATPPAIVAPPGPVAVDNIDERVVEAPMPRYPYASRKAKEQGTVVLRVVIGTDGRIAQISLSESSGFERLDKAALDAVKRWRWQPWTRNGQPIEVRGLIPFPFVLKA